MKIRILALTCLCVLVLNMAGSAVADVKSRKAVSPANQLALLLPASDGVVTVDVKRFFSVALPKLLTANQPMLDQVTAKIALMKERTGIDIRQFEYLAAGVTAKPISGKEYDIDPVIIARGQISSGSLIGAAKLASNGKYKEEKAGDRTIYIFSAKDLAEQAKQNAPVGKNSGMADKMIDRMSKDVAVTAIDANTIAFGDLELVRQAVSAARTPVSNDLIGLLGKKETSVVNFAAKMPNGMSVFLPLENDELGKNIDAIRYVYGNMDVAAEAATVNITARTLQNAQATALLETLEGLQLIGKAFLGSAKGPDKQVFARMIDNAKFTAKSNEVMLDLSVPQSDIDILVGMLK
ncbi:MAG: hypothetical protein HOP17_16165 [Acidobacteria bacterium]|nr:hypothetical protein [Acidobacteriota bacterium]